MTARSRGGYPPDRPLVILMGGPMHRRVYWADEVPPRIPYRDAGRYATKALGDLYAHGCPRELADRLPAVWEWAGTAEPSLPARAPASGGFPRDCLYLGCEQRATMALAGPMERRPWHGCDDHWPAMQKSMALGRETGYSVDPTPC